ncbi:MAG: hypothetical protein JXA14_18705 [Anaerolineae bacterium]|nr:hypothetical protein [Anaerolineae bacterium]
MYYTFVTGVKRCTPPGCTNESDGYSVARVTVLGVPVFLNGAPIEPVLSLQR